MKRILLAAAATSVLFAGGDVEPLVDYDTQDVKQAVEVVKEVKPAPVPAPVVTPTPAPVPVIPPVVEPKNWYVGLDGMGAQFETDSGKCNGLGALVAKLGYDFNDYFGIEGRAGYGVIDADHDAGGKSKIKENYGLYLKPMLPLGESAHIFGLLGYAKAKVESTWDSTSTNGALAGTLNESSPSFGLGLNYDINDRWSVVAEGVRLLHKVDHVYDIKGGGTKSEKDINLDTYGLGINYKF